MLNWVCGELGAPPHFHPAQVESYEELDVSTYLNGIYLAKVDVPEQESLKSKFIVLK